MALPDPLRKYRSTPQGDTSLQLTYLFLAENRPVFNDDIALNQEVTAIDRTRQILASLASELGIYDHAQIILGNGGFGMQGIPTFDDAKGEAISIPFTQVGNVDAIVERLEKKIDEISSRYDPSHLIINDITVILRGSNPENGAAGKRRTAANKIWFVPGEYQTQENCFYYAWGMLNNKAKFATEYCDWLEEERRCYPSYKDYAKKKKHNMKEAAAKKRVSFCESFVNNEQIEFICKHSHRPPVVLIYDGQFQLVWQWKPPNHTAGTKVFEMQRSCNHYRPMIRWKELDSTLSDRIAAAINKKDERVPPPPKAQKIRLQFKAKEERNRRFVAWDLEATADADGNFKTYAVGMSWYREPFANGDQPAEANIHWDGELAMLHVDFWGLDALTRMVEFIWKHQSYFAESYWWAHNGGKFDVPLLLREALFDFRGVKIEGKKCTILNGRWIGFQALLLDQDGCDSKTRLYFRDSFAIMPGSLQSLCKDYTVPHQKLVETVAHDDISLDNFDTHETAIRRYLLHDCLGLLELVERFGTQVFNMSFTEKECGHEGERNTANALEALLGIEPLTFKKKRPDWLRSKDNARLELDGYCESELMAFEFQDEYHSERDHPWNQKATGGYARRVEDDKRKVQLCAKRGVRLVVVPYTAKAPTKMLAFCRRELARLGVEYEARDVSIDAITKPRVLARGGVCLSKVMTAAGIAKRTFFNKFYGQHSVFTMTQEQDAFIRSSYYGGRVELFHLGVVHGPVFYLDFTSLFPAMGKRLLPYGEPLEWKSFPKPDGASALPQAFFGFVRCLVRSTEHGKTRKPLHGIKASNSGSKLLFAHLDGWHELTLFSEELRKGEAEGLYEYKALNGFKFRRGYVMKEAFSTLFEMKGKAKQEGKGALEKALKVVINSMYGFWGLRTMQREAVKIFPSSDTPVYSYLSRDALIEEAVHGEYTCLRVLDDLNVKDFNVAIAAAITSYARIQLWELMDDIELRGGHVFSCDTDSITTDLDLSLHADLLRKHIPDCATSSPGTALGSLKCEGSDEVSKKLKKRGFTGADLDKAMAFERGAETWKPLPFYHPEGTLCNGANKLYALRTLLKHGGDHELCKAKGLSKGGFTFDNYVAMFDPLNPKPLTNPKQLSMRMGLSQYCRDGGIQAVRREVTPKEAKACYTKGSHSGVGPITPFLLPGTHDDTAREHAPDDDAMSDYLGSDGMDSDVDSYMGPDETDDSDYMGD